MKKTASSLKSRFMTAGVLASSALAAPAFASDNATLGTVAENFASANTSIRDAFLSFALLGGIVLVMFALFMFYQESKQPNQGNMKKGFFALVVGIGLLSMDFILGAGQNQLTGGSNEWQGTGENIYTGDSLKFNTSGG